MKKICIVENLIRSLIASEIKPSTILTALHNVCAHGEILKEMGYDVTDVALEALFDGFDVSIDALQEMEG